MPNPCYQYTTASASVKTACTQVATRYAANVVNNNAYVTIDASSDAAQINDVLYANGAIPSVLLTYGVVTPANPYTFYPLTTYNNNIGSYLESYSSTLPWIGNWGTTPTNAGYVPYSPEVLYALRGWQLSGMVAWWFWLAAHVFFLIGFRNRLVVLINWAWSYFTYQRHARIIVGPDRTRGEEPDEG